MASDSTIDVAQSLIDPDNPLLKDFDFPPFDVVEPKHVRPGIKLLIHRLDGDLMELERTVEPTWPKLVEPLERIMDRLQVVWGAVKHLKSVKDSTELRYVVEEIQPEKIKFGLRLEQSKPIYEAFKSIRNSPSWDTLSEARNRIVEAKIKEAVLNGVALDDEKREKLNEIQQELEKLSQKFSENILDATKKFEKLIADKNGVLGLPSTALGLAAQIAVSKGHENATPENGPWIITLDTPSFMAVMQHARNRSLREEVFKAYITRASSGDLDNASIITEILKLRLQKAKILGYDNYAEVSLTTKMATADRVQELLENLRVASWEHHVKDIEEMKAFAKESGAPEANSIDYWDVPFWSERLREAKYDINEVWNQDVKFYHVKSSCGQPIAYFYFDPYSRPAEKQDGAWMDEVFSRSLVLAPPGALVRLPVAHMVCNQMPPVGDKPSLMTFREVETVFHEFGHALQHMLTKQDEGLVAGIRGIEWDAVELPSQFMENWCYHKETLLGLAKQYQTGRPLPEEMYSKLLAGKSFRAGSMSIRQVRFAPVDLELHTTFDPYGEVSIFDIDRKISEKTYVLPPFPDDRFLCSFSHIFAGDYAAGYYSYKWAEVLSSDAFSAFEEAGLENDKAIKEMGNRFRETILALGGGKSALEVFVAFRGREPSPEPLLRHNGLLPIPASA